MTGAIAFPVPFWGWTVVAPSMDLAIAGKAFVGGRLLDRTIGIRAGKIARIARSVKADRAVAVKGVIVPGAIDSHVHFRDPGTTHKEDFRTGSTAAACGGVTTVLDMPNTAPPVDSRSAFEEKLSLARRKACVDFGLLAAPDDRGRLALGDRPAAYKLYLARSTGGLLVAPERLRSIVAEGRRLGVPLVVHAEDEGCVARHARARGTEATAHALSRPADCELAALKRLAPFRNAELIHIAHLSTAQGLAVVSRASWSFEVTAHHVLMTEDDLAKREELACNPPLRTASDSRALWRALVAGKATLASDHAPHLLEEKWHHAGAAPAGLPGVETTIPVMMALVARRKLPLAALLKASAELPARRFALRTKGKIAVGMDADLAVYDPSNRRKIDRTKLHSRCGWTPFELREAVFPSHVFLRGQALVTDGAFVGAQGLGQEVATAAAVAGAGARAAARPHAS